MITLKYDDCTIKDIIEFGKDILNGLNNIFFNINKQFKNILFNKKISKKRFIKLLQSKGTQRNTINEIVNENKEKYTYARYRIILIKYSKDKKV